MKKLLVAYFLFFACTAFAQNLTANFSVNTLEICLGEEITFTDLSSAGGSPIENWTWDFGDGFDSQLQNTSHIYTSPGTYNITLTIQAENGTSDVEIKTAYITVNPLPIVDFVLNGQACSVPFNATFSNTSSNGGYTYNWNFGNGQTSADLSPTGITYITSGTYTVSLTVTNSTTGCVNSLISPITVDDFQTNIVAPDSVCVGETIQINDASTNGVNSWNWNFGDGSTSTQKNNSYQYTAPGTYTITLNSTNTNSGCSETATQTIVVLDSPNASFTVDQTIGCNPTIITFTNTSSGGSTFNWNFGDGSSYVGINPPPHSYLNTGSYNVQLLVENAFGCIDEYVQLELITIELIDPGFMIDPQGGCEPLDVQFTDTTSVPNPTQDPIVNWDWDFGNGNTFNGQFPPIETYNLGVYDVSLIVTTSSGCVETALFEDSVFVGIIDSIEFTHSPNNVCATDIVSFNADAFISVPHDPNEVTYSWQFGDGGLGNTSNPNYIYQLDTGFFDITLTVNFRGCLDSLTLQQTVYVNAPVSSFSPSTSIVCNPNSFPVTIDVNDASIIGELSDDADMTWSWGDNTSTFFDDQDIDDTDKGSTSHDYSTYGTYTIEQFINNSTTGCTHSSTAVITISYIDTDFSFTNDSVCLGESIFINDLSQSSHSILYDSINHYYWMGNNDTLPTPSHNYTYPGSGSFDIIHVVRNLPGCVDSDTLFVLDVLELPIADANPDATTGCAPLTVTFTNNSSTTGNGVPIESFEWTYFDNTAQTTTSVNQTVSDIFTTEGIFTTTLVATDEFGCVSPPFFIDVDVTKPTAGFIVDSVLCDLENYTAMNQSTGDGPMNYEWIIDGISSGTTFSYSGVFDDVQSSMYSSQNHDITLITTDVNGCSDTLLKPIIVSLPHADAGFSFSGATINGDGEFDCPPVFASLGDSSSSYGAIETWNWTLGNGNNSTLQNPSNTYVFAGTYSVTMNITDEYGCSDDTTFLDYLTINGPSGDPSWSNVGTICDPTFEFYVDNQIGVTNVEWTFGDGNIINDTNILSYNYDTTGNYLPSVIISDDFGCEIPYLLPPIDVAINELNAFFTASILEGQASEIFTFYDASFSSADPIVEWYWDFTENTRVNNTDADVVYDWGNLGYQTVTLIVSDANGCSNSYSIEVLITADFIVPNVFTPNGDQINDLFKMDFDVFNGYDYVILNRWGNVVEERTNHTGTILWDGLTPSGKPANEGVYFYKITGTRYDDVTITVHGHLTLIRK